MFNRELHDKKNGIARNDAHGVNLGQSLSPTKLGAHKEEGSGAPSPRAALPRTPAVEAPAPVVSKLIVGPRIKLRGVEITDCDTLVVEGRVEASMDSRVVEIAEHGLFSGKASMDVAEIWGRFEGELTARKSLIVHATGHVIGKIRYGTICVEEGAELSGDVSMTTAAASQASAAETSAMPAIAIVPLPFAAGHS